jgi:hypothetical protein
MARFHKNAWAAVKRREGSYALEEVGNGLRSVFLGGVPLVGMLWFDWSAPELMLFLLVGTWAGILCDIAKLWFLEKQIRDWGNEFYDNWCVWTIVASLRAGRKTAPKEHLRARYEPWVGVLVDLSLGGLGTVIICLALAAAGEITGTELLQQQRIMLPLVALVAYQILFTVWEIVSHKYQLAGNSPVKVAVGKRGIGLFMLLFLMVFVVETWSKQSSASKIALLVINGGLVFYGLITIVGPFFIRKETAWLRDYLEKRSAKSG